MTDREFLEKNFCIIQRTSYPDFLVFNYLQVPIRVKEKYKILENYL
jgi:hypothetical protein